MKDEVDDAKYVSVDDANDTESDDIFDDERKRPLPEVRLEPDVRLEHDVQDEADVDCKASDDVNLTSSSVNDDFVVVEKNDIEATKDNDSGDDVSRRQRTDGYTW